MTLNLGEPLQDKFGGCRHTWLSGTLQPLPRDQSEALNDWLAGALADFPFRIGSLENGTWVVREYLKGSLNEFQVTWPVQFGTLYWLLWIRLDLTVAIREAVSETI